MTEAPQDLKALEIGKKLEVAMEFFLADPEVIRFGPVSSHELPAQAGLPPRKVVTVLIFNPEKHKPLTDRLLELARSAGLTVDSIEDLIRILHRKGFSLIAQNDDARSYQRVRKILPPIATPK
ncbi:hypothetical protein HYU91_04005 [Candidatus Collierbacteria bacterium]|nr:hypothetical protein [Candidatus Collierbacteria bacterium]